MLISKEEKRKVITDDKFKIFLYELIESNGDLAVYAEKILKDIKGGDYLGLLDASDSLTFILADYYRRIHAERSGDFVKKPDTIRIESPRTSLIPSRLFNFVAQIVACHGKSRESLFEIPKRNDGVDSTDYAHPRYIASLLRIGDLLDIDDGRFCQTLLTNIGDVPKSSMDHQNKHASIHSLQIDSDSIDIEATCYDYGSYNAQRAWFDYIHSEFEFQKKYWNKIVPNGGYRALPTINKLECNLLGYLSVDGSAPKITLDTKRVYDYLSGSLIYSERFPYIRELIQNAVDATIYKVWDRMIQCENVDYLNDDALRNKFNNLLNEERIDIYFKEKERHGESIKYNFIIRDYSTGISFDDIKKILNVGSSSTNARKKIFHTMKEWSKPTGFFGLGLQSVFKMCKNVTIKTKSRNDKCYFISVMNTEHQPEFTVKEVYDDYFDGTEVSLEIEEDLIPNSVPHSANDILKNFDPVKDSVLEILPAVVSDIIKGAFLTTKVKVFLNDEAVIFHQPNNTNLNTDYTNGADYYLEVDLDKLYRSNIYYKDAKIDVERSNLAYTGVVGRLNIFRGNANDWITIDRNKLRADRSEALSVLYLDIIKSNRQKIIEATSDKSMADLYYYALHDESNDGIWKNYIICNTSLEEYLNSKKNLLIWGGSYANCSNDDEHIELGLKTNCISNVVNKLGYNIHMKSLREDISDHYGSQMEYYSFEIEFKKSEVTEYSIDPDIIKRWILNNNDSFRYVIPCFNPKYMKISFPEKFIPKWCFAIPNNWSFNNFIFIPFKNYEKKNDDVRVIYEYYKKFNLAVEDYQGFEKMYLEAWAELR